MEEARHSVQGITVKNELACHSSSTTQVTISMCSSSCFSFTEWSIGWSLSRQSIQLADSCDCYDELLVYSL